MKWGGILLILILILPALIPGVDGDGTPIVDKHLLSVTHENRQIAMVDVHDNYEILHLFLSIVSLDPGKNITVLIPLRTKPTEINVKNDTDWNFNWENNITQASEYYSASEYGYKNFKDAYLFSMSITMLAPFFFFGGPALVMFSTATAMGGAGSGGATYHFQSGDTLTLYNVTSVEDAKEIYEKYNATLPENVKDTLNRYSSYYLVALNARTRAPIDERKYAILEAKCPETMEKLREYVKEHPRVDMKLIGSQIVDMPDYGYLMDSLNEEAKDNYTLWRYFTDTLLSIYGYGDMRGLSLHMKLPLYHGSAFYPLGTSPAWNSSGMIRVWFRVPQDKEMQMNRNAVISIKYNGSRYYRWKFDNELPDYDIEGKAVPAGFGTTMNDLHVSLGFWLAHNGVWLGITMGFLTSVLLWFGIVYLAMYMWGGKGAIKNTKKMVKLSFETYLISFLATIVVGLFFLYYLPYGEPEKYGVKNDRKKIWISLLSLIPPLTIIFSVGFYLFYYYILYPMAPAHEAKPFTLEILGFGAFLSMITLLIPLIVIDIVAYTLHRESRKK